MSSSGRPTRRWRRRPGVISVRARRSKAMNAGFIGITDLDIVLAGSARAGMAGETAVEEFGEVLALAAAA